MKSNQKKNKEWGIYQITFPNGKSYIGQSSDLKRRMREYKNWEKCCTAQTALYNAFKKYGYDSVNITFLYKNGGKVDYDILNQKEIDYIAQYNTQVPNGYNIEKGGNNHEITNGGWLAEFIKELWPYPYEPIVNQDETIEYKDCIEWAKKEKMHSDSCYGLEELNFPWKYKNEKQLKCSYGQFLGDVPTIYENKMESMEYHKACEQYKKNQQDIKLIKSDMEAMRKWIQELENSQRISELEQQIESQSKLIEQLLNTVNKETPKQRTSFEM